MSGWGVSRRGAFQEIVPSFWALLCWTFLRLLERPRFLDMSQRTRRFILGMWGHCRSHTHSLVTICGDACPLSCVSAEACFTSWPNAQGRRDGKLVNAALLSLINESCVSVCCATLLLSQLFGPLVFRHDRVTREVGHVSLVGRDRGRRGYWVALYLYIYTAWLLMSVFL